MWWSFWIVSSFQNPGVPTENAFKSHEKFGSYYSRLKCAINKQFIINNAAACSMEHVCWLNANELVP